MRSRIVILGLSLAVPLGGVGCGSTIPKTYAHAIVGADGQPIVLNDVRDIVNDPDLNDEEKRQALRVLGLEDEILIGALLEL